MGRIDPLAARRIHMEAGAGEQGRLLFDARSEINELVMASLARGAPRDAADFRQRTLNLPNRETSGGSGPGTRPITLLC